MLIANKVWNLQFYHLSAQNLVQLKPIMGNDQCNQCKEHQLEENQAYGSYQLYQSSNKAYAVVQKKVQSDPVLQKKVKKQLETRKSIKQPNIVSLHSYQIQQTDYGFKVTMMYEFIPKSLRNRMEEVRERGQYFSEREIFSVLYGVRDALNKFSEYKIKHCCVNLDTILCKNNFYKLTDVSSTTYITSYDLVSKNDREQFLSEKLLNSLMSKSLAPDYTLQDDLFSLGMICLMLAGNKSPKDMYTWDQKGYGFINTFTVNYCFKTIQKKYSSKLFRQIKTLIYQTIPSPPQSYQSSNTNLSDSLQWLEEDISKVMQRAKKMDLIDHIKHKEQADQMKQMDSTDVSISKFSHTFQ